MKKIFNFFRFTFLITAFIFLLVPFMFFSVLNKGVKKAKNILGFQSKDSHDDQIFTDNQAWADPPGGGGRCIYFHYLDAKGNLTKFSELIPRTEESYSLIPVPSQAISPNGELYLDLKWTRTHELVSLGIIEHNSSKNHGDFEEMDISSAVNVRDGKNYSDLLKNRNSNYLHTVQGDTVDLIFKSKDASNELKLQVQELDPEESFIDQVKVFKVRHKADEEILVDNEFKNFYVIAKEKIANAVLPKRVLVMNKEVSPTKSIKLNYGQNSGIEFSGLKSGRHYFLVAKARERGFSPQAKTVFHTMPKALRYAALAGFALIFSRLFNKLFLSLPLFALLTGQSTPYLAIWNGKNYVIDNDVMFSSVFNYSDNLNFIKNRYEMGHCPPDLYKIKQLTKVKGDTAESYLFSVSGFYTDLRVQHQNLFKSFAWLTEKIKNGS